MTLTTRQEQVLAALQASTEPKTAYELLDNLSEQGFRAPPQIYRALTRLTELGHVHRLESLNAFVACDHTGCDDKHPSVFLICNRCRQVLEVQAQSVLNGLDRVTDEAGFRLNQAVVELSGVCRGCENPAIAD